MPNHDTLILKKRDQFATPAPVFAHKRAIAVQCFVERLPALGAPLTKCSDSKRHAAVPYSQYGLLHANLCNREKELILLTANTVATMNDVFK